VVTLSTTNNGQEVDVAWTKPDDKGAEILSYTISFRKADLTFSTNLADCDGSNALIISDASCTIPLSSFTSAPFSLQFPDEIIVKIVATNIKGDSEESPQGSGATVITAPDAPL